MCYIISEAYIFQIITLEESGISYRGYSSGYSYAVEPIAPSESSVSNCL